MPGCPKCGDPIYSLKQIAPEMVTYRFDVKNGIVDYKEDVEAGRDPVDGDNGVFQCPDCGANLFESEIDAIHFLKLENNGLKDGDHVRSTDAYFKAFEFAFVGIIKSIRDGVASVDIHNGFRKEEVSCDWLVLLERMK